MAILTANNQSLTEITSLPSGVSGGALVLLATETASSSSTVEFDSDIDDTYDEYVFKFYDIHPSASGEQLSFQGNAAGGSGYNETITSSFFRAVHLEDDSDQTLAYVTGSDLAQATGFQPLTQEIKNDADSSASGELWLFSPSSTTFVKHFMSSNNIMHTDPQSSYHAVAGYFNITSAIDEIQFKMSSGNIDAGTFKLYGIKDS